ncbi:MAG: hypothetical protein EOL91_08645 [Actinobacteria bacterium]|nr:hypothetical protein [Actinomycetota bacterium]
MGDRKEKIGHVSPASWAWVWGIVSAITYELVMLSIGQRGGALSHVIWWANDIDEGIYGWRWALVSGPIIGFLLWFAVHVGWGAGNGLHLLYWALGTTAALAILVLIHP